jgi:putative transcriptional regulator
MKDLHVETGQVLLAEPFMDDPNFKRSVILLCDHDKEDGSVGFILNKPMKMKVSELIEDFPEFDAELYFGGPVATSTVHYLHNVGNLLKDSTEVSRGVFWGGNYEELKFLAKTEVIKPSNIRFFLGYSGWSEGQLPGEMQIGSWVTADMHPNYIFKTKPYFLWRQVMENKGGQYAVLSQIPTSISWN